MQGDWHWLSERFEKLQGKKKRGLNLVGSGERKGCDWVKHQEESEIRWINGLGLGT